MAPLKMELFCFSMKPIGWSIFLKILWILGCHLLNLPKQPLSFVKEAKSRNGNNINDGNNNDDNYKNKKNTNVKLPITKSFFSDFGTFLGIGTILTPWED